MTGNTPDLDSRLGRYEMMYTIRLFEQKIEELFEQGLIHGTAHLCIGQEAAAVGAVSASRAGDPIVSSHRGHGHFLARSADPAALMGEMLGKATGPCRGRGGSQHLCARDLAFYGTNGITGGGIPTATGLGLSEKVDGSDKAVLCFFGDGATNQGTFHESLNMASIWDLPVVYICENNLYAMSTSVENSMGVNAVAERASAYRMPGRRWTGWILMRFEKPSRRPWIVPEGVTVPPLSRPDVTASAGIRRATGWSIARAKKRSAGRRWIRSESSGFTCEKAGWRRRA